MNLKGLKVDHSGLKKKVEKKPVTKNVTTCGFCYHYLNDYGCELIGHHINYDTEACAHYKKDII